MHPQGSCRGCRAGPLFHGLDENHIATPESEVQPQLRSAWPAGTCLLPPESHRPKSLTASLAAGVQQRVRELTPRQAPTTLRPQLWSAALTMEAQNMAHSDSMSPASPETLPDVPSRPSQYVWVCQVIGGENGGAEHGPLGLNVPRLPRYMVKALPEVGVEALSDRRLCQMFPADPHNTFVSARSDRHPPPI
ncbi:hypothetical protein N1851_035151 [Merluccius polli]|uniref:Uncharacterized protein n=1 Tax=Merluccius polli TaxID=89951 RepID=A0AA47NM26_MERPO|nr:hypothetical protein N1851_035151 [Merluccius polli]